MLRGLTERPNVQSTLILSRKDGSVIRATGLANPATKNETAPGATYPWSQSRETRSDSGGPEKGHAAGERSDESEGAQTHSMPIELLASTIFQFVINANSLGVTLGATTRSAGGRDVPHLGTSHGDSAKEWSQETTVEDESEKTIDDTDVQLLRLRTKHQEIIIFPDPNYICCVVQRVGKAEVGPERR